MRNRILNLFCKKNMFSYAKNQMKIQVLLILIKRKKSSFEFFHIKNKILYRVIRFFKRNITPKQTPKVIKLD